MTKEARMAALAQVLDHFQVGVDGIYVQDGIMRTYMPTSLQEALEELARTIVDEDEE